LATGHRRLVHHRSLPVRCAAERVDLGAGLPDPEPGRPALGLPAADEPALGHGPVVAAGVRGLHAAQERLVPRMRRLVQFAVLAMVCVLYVVVVTRGRPSDWISL